MRPSPCPASMRPRHISRGNRARGRRGRSWRSCFNEAAAYQPRKHRLKALRHRAHIPASMRPRHISRGNQAGRSRLPAPERASMRPRHISRGNTGRRGPGTWISPCFNEAAAYQPRKLDDSAQQVVERRASMRPRHISRGNDVRARLDLRGLGASMRPRHISRGNTPTAHFPWRRPAASMRPRHISRGNERRSLCARWASCCFNEAAAYQPRKLNPRRQQREQQHVASMRPRHISRGNAVKAELPLMDTPLQ